ncbi:MAG TPA: TlpA disulfide reductase family protein [Gemmatimonadales bacterium]|nr:TlpA disulfide reductase family protein [Gemmatimonadales bacterium]
MKRTCFAALGALLLATAPCLAQEEAGIRVGAAAPAIKVNDLDGKPVDLGQWIGHRPVLLEFWATWCPNCEELLPKLKTAYTRWSDRVEFLGINVTVNQTPEKVRGYVKEHAMPFRILYDDEGTSVRAFDAPATAFVVILDGAGTVVYAGLGADQSFEAALERATSTPKPSR